MGLSIMAIPGNLIMHGGESIVILLMRFTGESAETFLAFDGVPWQRQGSFHPRLTAARSTALPAEAAA
jgi:hypothetical protein